MTRPKIFNREQESDPGGLGKRILPGSGGTSVGHRRDPPQAGDVLGGGGPVRGVEPPPLLLRPDADPAEGVPQDAIQRQGLGNSIVPNRRGDSLARGIPI